MLLELAVAVVVSGAISSLLAGLFGIGGGAVLVPVLYQGLTFLGIDEGARMHFSAGTSIGIIVPTATRDFSLIAGVAPSTWSCSEAAGPNGRDRRLYRRR